MPKLPKRSKSFRDRATGRASDLADKLAPHVETAKEKTVVGLTEARKQAGPIVSDAVAEARERFDSDVKPALEAGLAEARERTAPLVAEARERTAPLVAEARKQAGPRIKEARKQAAPVVAEARERFDSDVKPVLAAGIAAAADATEDIRAEARKRSAATALALKGELEAPEPKHRVRKVLAFLGIAGVAAFVAKKLTDQPETSAWQSATPTPTPAAAPPVQTPSAHASDPAEGPDDAGAAAPGEAAADQADEGETRGVTTPDAPATEVDLETPEDDKA